jgi:hypothetical protein
MLRTRTLLALAFLTVSLAAPVAAKSILIYPTAGDGAPAQDLSSVNRLFRDAVEGSASGTVVTQADSACGKRECALSGAVAAGADQVIYSSFYKLGSKWIFSATIIEASGENSFNQRLTAVSIEDMEAVTLRMADALLKRKTAEQVTTVDNLTEKESTLEPERRRSLYKGGIAVGYMFPVGPNSFEYTNENYQGDLRTHGYDQIIRLTWLNTWEFRNNLQLGTDLVWNTPDMSFGADASLRYLFARGDYTPFVGGGLGLHYVHGDNLEDDGSAKRNSGPAVNAQAGMMLFRTYDVNVMVRAQYQVIFNEDIDNGIAADVGVSFGGKGGGGHGGGGSDSWSGWEFAGAGFLTLLIIGLLSN